MTKLKGLIFYLDAILAIVLALVVISGVGIYYSIEPELKYKTIHMEAEDLMQLTTRKINATEYGIPENYTNKTFLEVIGTLWLYENYTEATYLAEELFDEFDKRCIELSFDGDVIYNKTGCDETGKNVAVANRLISGYIKEKKPDGYTARIILKKLNRVASEYAYFGGYVGDGNITRNITLEGMENVIDAKMEIDAGSNFTFYVNGNYSGKYSPSPTNMSSDLFIVCNETYQSDYCNNFKEKNTIEFKFGGNKSYIGGGYVRIRYNTTEFGDRDIPEKYYFPGIDGIINVYSSFYVPGELQNMSAFIHYKSNYSIFMNIGDVLIYNGSSPDGQEINVTINDTQIKQRLLAGGFTYQNISKETIPLRLGMQNVSYLIIGQEEADVFSVTDVSGSMGTCDIPSNSTIYDCSNGYCSGGSCTNGPWWCCFWACCDMSQSYCNDCGGTWVINEYYRERINVAKESNKDFIDIVTNTTNNRVGLVAYESNVDSNECHDLSENRTSLREKVEEWSDGGGTCICCGINEAVDRLLAQSNEGKFRSMVVMSDGDATTECSRQGWTEDLNGNGNADEPEDDAIQAACDAWQDHNITVYAIGFGEGADEDTLWDIADCGHGEYHYANVSELSDIYELIAKEILNASYQAQTVEIYGGDYGNIKLYPDSYIDFNFSSSLNKTKYGEISINIESPKFGGLIESPKNGTFVVPENTTLIDAKITSYSSDFWTDKASIYNGSEWKDIFNLKYYGTDYVDLGDPSIVYIPIEEVNEVENRVSIDTGAGTNSTGGSPDSRVIYTIAVDILTEYGGVFNKSSGFERKIYYDIDLDGVADGDVNVTIGNSSDLWDPDLDAIDNAFSRLLEKANFYNDTDPGIPGTDGQQTNPINIHPSEMEFNTIPIGGIPWLWGPGLFTLKVW